MRLHIELPSADVIARFSIVKPCTDEEKKVALAIKHKQPTHRSRKPIPPIKPKKPVMDGRGGARSRPLVAKSKPFNGALLKYCEAGDKRGYIREYARLWKLEQKKNK
jgi:hypothetical protein